MTPPDKSRGSQRDVSHRFARSWIEQCDDGWPREDETAPPRPTTLHRETARSIVSENSSPDVPFSRSINPIAGCEHGCIYCYARPTHAYRDHSPGLEFETELYYKPNAAELLRQQFAGPSYQPETIVIGANTDPYQPAERQLGLTRELLQVFLEHRHPVGLITKGSGILRDLDLLQALAADQLVKVMISVTTLDDELKRRMEPRTASPAMRLKLIRQLHERGIPVGVLVAPVIPFINDAEIEAIIAAVAEAGACEAGYVMLRLPHEVLPLFEDWLQQHYPDRAERVMQRVRDLRGGQNYDSRFGQRMAGQGIFADLIRQRFAKALRQHGLAKRAPAARRTDLFRVPGRPEQGDFGF